MNILPRIPIEIGDPQEVTILLVGCGGTGSFAALHLARLAYEARRGNGPRLRLIFVDPDRVEEKNIGRQNFCPAEIGLAKAMTLAGRYNLAFGLEIGVVVGPFEVGMVTDWAAKGHHWDAENMLLVIGCVDTPAARAEIARAVDQANHKHVQRRIWWLDAGNSEHAGQVLIGNSLMAEPIIDPLLGRCVGLPWPSLQEPGLIVNSQLSMVNGQVEGLSCAELMALNAQSLMINQAMAGWIGVYVYRLLAHDLDIYQTWLDLRGGNVRSVPIVEGLGMEVKPVVPQVWHEVGEMLERLALGACPECGAALTEGRDILEDSGEEAEIVFCPACDWVISREQYDLMQEAGIGLDMWREWDDGDDPDDDDGGRVGAGVAGAVMVAE